MRRAAFNEAGVATRSDQALQVLLSRRCHAEGSSSNVRRGHGVFRVYRNVHSARRGLVPTPDAVIFAELLSPLVEGAISVPLPACRSPSIAVRQPDSPFGESRSRQPSRNLSPSYSPVAILKPEDTSFLLLGDYVGYVRWQCASLAARSSNNNAYEEQRTGERE